MDELWAKSNDSVTMAYIASISPARATPEHRRAVTLALADVASMALKVPYRLSVEDAKACVDTIRRSALGYASANDVLKSVLPVAETIDARSSDVDKVFRMEPPTKDCPDLTEVAALMSVVWAAHVALGDMRCATGVVSFMVYAHSETMFDTMKVYHRNMALRNAALAFRHHMPNPPEF